MEASLFILFVTLVLFSVVVCVFAADAARLKERKKQLERLRIANEMFFAQPEPGMTMNWMSASDLLSYVGGIRREPPSELHYDVSIPRNVKTVFWSDETSTG